MANHRDPENAIEDFRRLTDVMKWMPDASVSQRRKVNDLAFDTVKTAVAFTEWELNNKSERNLHALTTAVYVLTEDSDFENIHDHLVLWLRAYGINL